MDGAGSIHCLFHLLQIHNGFVKKGEITLLRVSEHGQAMAPETIPMTQEAFAKNNETAVYWLGAAGVFINSHGTTIMIDPTIAITGQDPPLSEKGGAPYLVLPPILPSEVKKLDAVLFTHADDDHMPLKTCLDLLPSGCKYYGTAYAKAKLIMYGIPENRIEVIVPQQTYDIKGIPFKAIGALHPWQRIMPDIYNGWEFSLEDCCGLKFFFEDGVFLATGDTVLLDEHLQQQDVDMIAIDICDGRTCYHMGTSAAMRVINSMDQADVLPVHWGCFDLPEHVAMNGNPERMIPLVKGPDRMKIAAPGEKLVLMNHH